jgi:hypothetical protein
MELLLNSLSRLGIAYYNRDPSSLGVYSTNEVITYPCGDYYIISTFNDLVIFHHRSLMIINKSCQYIINDRTSTVVPYLSLREREIRYEIFTIGEDLRLTFIHHEGGISKSVKIYRNILEIKYDNKLEKVWENFYTLNYLSSQRFSLSSSFRTDGEPGHVNLYNPTRQINVTLNKDERITQIKAGKFVIKYENGTYYYNCQRTRYYLTDDQILYLYRHPDNLLKFYNCNNTEYTRLMNEVFP